MTGPQWWGTLESQGQSGLGCRGSWEGKGKLCGCRGYFQDSGSSSAYIWVVDFGDNPPHETGPGGFPEKSGPEDHRETDTAALGRKLGVPPLGGGDAGGGFGEGGGLGLE